MYYFRLTLLIFIARNFVGGEEFLPFPSPIAELNRIQVECEKKGILRIKETKIDAKKCLVSARAIPSDSIDIPNSAVEMMMTETECADVSKHNECWNPVIQKINSCIPGRGDTVGKIYKALSEIVCRNGKGRSSVKEDDLCKPVHRTTECNKTEESLSSDLCRSFKAQRACETSALAACKYEDQKQLILKDMYEVEKHLKCSGSFVRSIAWISIVTPALLLLFKICF